MSTFKAVGIEIEGGWKNVERVAKWFKSDSSAVVPGYQHVHNLHKGDYLINPPKTPVSGEVNSEPYAQTGSLHSWIERAHPDGVADTCGVHIHTSFNTLTDYAKIMTETFYNRLTARMMRFGNEEVNGKDAAETSFWRRFWGFNGYSQRGFVHVLYGNKNWGVNYGAFRGDNEGLRKYKTFEMRIFPSFARAETTHKGVEAYLEVINETLNEHPPFQPEIEVALKNLKGLHSDVARLIPEK